MLFLLSSIWYHAIFLRQTPQVNLSFQAQQLVRVDRPRTGGRPEDFVWHQEWNCMVIETDCVILISCNRVRNQTQTTDYHNWSCRLVCGYKKSGGWNPKGPWAGHFIGVAIQDYPTSIYFKWKKQTWERRPSRASRAWKRSVQHGAICKFASCVVLAITKGW